MTFSFWLGRESWDLRDSFFLYIRSCQKLRNGARPVPGPTMMTGVRGSSGKWKLGALRGQEEGERQLGEELGKVGQCYGAMQAVGSIPTYMTVYPADNYSHKCEQSVN